MREVIEHTEGINRLMARYGVKFGIYKNGEFHEQLFRLTRFQESLPMMTFSSLKKG